MYRYFAFYSLIFVLYFTAIDKKIRKEMENTSSRIITKKVLSVEQAEGVGARVRRSIGRSEVR